MIRRPPRSTLFSLHDALPISLRRRSAPAPPAAGRGGRRARRVPDVPAAGGGGARLGLRATWDRRAVGRGRSEEHTSELQSRQYLVCRLLLEKKKTSLDSLLHN